MAAGSRFVNALLSAILLVATGASDGRAGDERPSREVLDDYFFLPRTDTYLIGDRIYKWESDPIVVLYREADRPLVRSIVDRLHEAGALGDLRVLLLPPIDELRSEAYDRPNFTIAISTDFFESMMAPGPLRGLEAYQAHARASGCYAQPMVPYVDRDYVIKGAQIVAREDLAPARLEDCLFRGFLLGAGLMYTERLAFRPAPLGEPERRQALRVLELLYHPAVAPGMTRDQFYEALEAEGLIER